MKASELLSTFRAEVSDLSQPYLWADKLVYSYINDAQSQFCRNTEGIEDSRSFKVSVLPTKEWYPIDPQILKIRKVTNVATGREVRVVNPERMSAEGMYFDGRVGPVNALIVGLQKNMARAYPVPATEVLLRIDTFRLPEALTPQDEPEIDEQHHRHLLLWVKHLAYDVQDSDGYDRRLSQDYAVRFADYCAQARREQERARRNVGAVIYGGL